MWRYRCALALLAALSGAACSAASVDRLAMATTTSVGNSGLLDVLLPAYEGAHGVKVQAHLLGSGRALAMLESGDVDIVISHAPEAEGTALARHPGWWYRKIMYNDFVIVGPEEDPAAVRQAASATDAARRIAASGVRFISRGDQSGTHEREQRLWSQSASRPKGELLVIAGAGMGSTLRVASEAAAYTLTDRATFLQHAGRLRLALLFDGDPDLMNSYAVLVDPASPRAKEAQAFGLWLVSGEGRGVIGSYRIAGTTVGFTPWPGDRSAVRPDDRPR